MPATEQLQTQFAVNQGERMMNELGAFPKQRTPSDEEVLPKELGTG